jgi:hypothetical protein
MDVYVPAAPMLLRFRDRAQLTQRDIELRAAAELRQRQQHRHRDSRAAAGAHHRNQLDRIIVRVPIRGTWAASPT